ncbi:MAG TPA: hypothetical protein VN654_23235 [Vicinamibacterales bacterium]|jgi:hypothetical protein|nr:hypothetical protein [Vicinamibacterales bacterium]
MIQPALQRVFVLGAAVCLGVCAGCARDLPRPSQVPLGRPFELHAEASATLADGLTVTFDRVRSDSRCPMDVVCITAGDAVVVVRLASQGGQAERELHTNPGGAGTADTSYQSYAITLVALTPYPRTDRPIRPVDYVATLTVERR